MPQNAQNPDPGPPGGFWGRLRRFVDGWYIDRDACDRAFARMHRRDAIGDRLHLYLAGGGIVCLFGPLTMTELAFAPLLVFFFVRIVNTLPIWIHGFGQPVVLVGLMIATWMGVSLVWSGDRAQGLDEMAELRWLALTALLLPVIEKRRVLIGALCLGLAMGQLGQLLDVFDGFGIGWLAAMVQNHEGRVSGWWHPVVGGSLLVSAMGLHMPALLWGRGRTRLLGWGGFALSGVGVIATGSRGAWIAAALMTLTGVGFALCLRRISPKRTLLVGGAALLVALAGSWLMRGAISQRLDESRAELREMAQGDYSSYSGIRVRMAQLAGEAIAQHPLGGVGAGGYQAWANRADPSAGVHAHAHNSVLHIWATLGVVGLALWVLLVVVMLRGAWRIARQPDAHPYELAPLMGLLGLVLASITDSTHLNAQTAALIGVLAALCPAYCPKHPRWPASGGLGPDSQKGAE